jgi:hypothetical protein
MLDGIEFGTAFTVLSELDVEAEGVAVTCDL